MKIINNFIKNNILNTIDEGIANVSFQNRDKKFVINGFFINRDYDKYKISNSHNFKINTTFQNINLNGIEFNSLIFEIEFDLKKLDKNFEIFIKNERFNTFQHYFGVPHYFFKQEIPNLNLMQKIGCDDDSWYKCGGFTLAKKIIKIIEKEKFNKEINIIDLGGGTGRIADHFIKNGYKNLIICDNDSELTNFASKIGIKTENNFFNINKAHFDLIFSHSLFPHINMNEIKKILLHSEKLLKKNGIMCMSFLSKSALLFEAVTKFQSVLYILGKNIVVKKKNVNYHPALAKTKGDFPKYYHGYFNSEKIINSLLPKNLKIIKNLNAYSHHQDLILIKKIN